MKIKPVYILIVFLIIAVFQFVPFSAVAALGERVVSAQVEEPALPDPLTTIRIIDMALLLPMVAFFKARFDLKGNWVLGVALIIWLILWFTPEIYQLWPPAALLISCMKQFFATVGSFDTVIDLKQKFSVISATTNQVVSEMATDAGNTPFKDTAGSVG